MGHSAANDVLRSLRSPRGTRIPAGRSERWRVRICVEEFHRAVDGEWVQGSVVGSAGGAGPLHGAVRESLDLPVGVVLHLVVAGALGGEVVELGLALFVPVAQVV